MLPVEECLGHRQPFCDPIVVLVRQLHPGDVGLILRDTSQGVQVRLHADDVVSCPCNAYERLCNAAHPQKLEAASGGLHLTATLERVTG